LHRDGSKSKKRQPFVVSGLVTQSVLQSSIFLTGCAELDGVSGYSVSESDIPEYRQSLDRLDMVLAHIERYIHIAYATLKRDAFVRRMYTMVGLKIGWMDGPDFL
jgi:hypothetical protein